MQDYAEIEMARDVNFTGVPPDAADLIWCIMPLADPGRELAAAARRALAPLGCIRKGRSRTWLADQRLWAIVIEFQPSGFARGSYLNVAAHWFWHPQPWSLDHPKRVGGFVPVQDAQQFAAAAEQLAACAAEEVRKLRTTFASLADIARVLVAQGDALDSAWPLYHAAVAAGLGGDSAGAARLFARLAREPADAKWYKQLQKRGAILARQLDGARGFRAAVLAIVQDARARHGLPPDPTCLDGS